jgi:hypothetical protein
MNNRITSRTVYALLPVTPGEATKNRLRTWDAYPLTAARPELFLLWLETAHPRRGPAPRRGCASANKDLVYDRPHFLYHSGPSRTTFEALPRSGR